MPAILCTSLFSALVVAVLYSGLSAIPLAREPGKGVSYAGGMVEKSPPPPSEGKIRKASSAKTGAKTRQPFVIHRQIIPPRSKARSRYTRRLRRQIRRFNKKGRQTGDIKLYAKENRWGPAVKIQSCYGDNILSRFSVRKNGTDGKIWFQFKNATARNRRRGRGRHRWIMVDQEMLIRGRHIYLRAQSSKGNGVLTLKVRGNCIE